jgi:hypothetical protein
MISVTALVNCRSRSVARSAQRSSGVGASSTPFGAAQRRSARVASQNSSHNSASATVNVTSSGRKLSSEIEFTGSCGAGCERQRSSRRR